MGNCVNKRSVSSFGLEILLGLIMHMIMTVAKHGSAFRITGPLGGGHEFYLG